MRGSRPLAPICPSHRKAHRVIFRGSFWNSKCPIPLLQLEGFVLFNIQKLASILITMDIYKFDNEDDANKVLSIFADEVPIGEITLKKNTTLVY